MSTHKNTCCVLQGDFKERIKQQKSAQNRLREQRQQVARGKKYHSDFHVQHRARMMRARTKEERVRRRQRTPFLTRLLQVRVSQCVWIRRFSGSCFRRVWSCRRRGSESREFTPGSSGRSARGNTRTRSSPWRTTTKTR